MCFSQGFNGLLVLTKTIKTSGNNIALVSELGHNPQIMSLENQLVMCSSRKKCPHPPPLQKGFKFPGIGGYWKTKTFYRNVWSFIKCNFQRYVGNPRKHLFCRRGMDTLWNYMDCNIMFSFFFLIDLQFIIHLLLTGNRILKQPVLSLNLWKKILMKMLNWKMKTDSRLTW